MSNKSWHKKACLPYNPQQVMSVIKIFMWNSDDRIGSLFECEITQGYLCAKYYCVISWVGNGLREQSIVSTANKDLRISGENIHYSDVIMDTMASQITSLTIVYSTVYSGTDHRKYHSSASLACVRGIHRWPMNSSHKWPVTRKMFPFDDITMYREWL